ncbi:MAG: DUF2752 domain-containing protein [Actinobacteria bacterium]|nr:DUF2752 domain-containing protein [Actinomycetota bacterium]
MGRDQATVFAPDDVVVAERTDTRTLARRLIPPLATLAGTIAVLGYVAAVDPNQPGHYPLCPTRALFGVDCPGCGLMRATHDLVTGNVAGALDHNILIVVLAPLAVVLWVRWLLRAWRGREDAVTYATFRRRNTVMLIGLGVVLAFGVIRNFVPYLGSGIG